MELPRFTSKVHELLLGSHLELTYFPHLFMKHIHGNACSDAPDARLIGVEVGVESIGTSICDMKPCGCLWMWLMHAPSTHAFDYICGLFCKLFVAPEVESCITKCLS
eukprot:1148104-Pelagomonas_calceolata.AAC.3